MSGEDKGSVLTRELKNGALLLSLLSAIFYLVGFANDVGYLRGFELRHSMFPISLERTLFLGALSLVGMIIRAAPPILIAIIFIFLVNCFWHYIRNFRLMRRATSMANKLSSWEVTIYFPNLYRLSKIVFWLMLLLVVVLVISSYSFWMGQQRANDDKSTWNGELSEFKAGIISTSSSLALVSFKISNSVTTQIVGVIITGSDSYCAVYTDEGVLILPKDQIENIKILKK